MKMKKNCTRKLTRINRYIVGCKYNTSTTTSNTSTRFEKEADIFSEIYCMKSSEYKLYGYKFLYSKYEIQPIVKQDDFSRLHP